MARPRPGYSPITVEVPDALLAAIDRAANGEPRNAWLLRVAAKAAGLKLSPAQIAPKRGRPRKPTPQT